MKPLGLRTWIEINAQALLHNYKIFRRLAGQRKLLAVVKSNAYGHNLIEASQLFAKAGANYLGVDSITEGLALRRAKISTPILILGYTLPECLVLASQKKIAISISSLEQITVLKKEALKYPKQKFVIHLKIDTGMHRQGFQLREFSVLIRELKKLPTNIKIEGVYSHLAGPAEKKLRTQTQKQIDLFRVAKNLLFEAGFNISLHHLGATGGTIAYSDLPTNMIRVGIGLYGYLPDQELADKKINLKPALTWKTIISEIKTVPKGEAVSYSFTEKLKRDSALAILPIGYWHGYPRLLSSTGEVLIAGRRAKIIGRVCMDMIIVDITDIPQAKVGTEVILLGDKITPEELAKKTNTSHYEIITRLNPLIKKFYQ